MDENQIKNSFLNDIVLRGEVAKTFPDIINKLEHLDGLTHLSLVGLSVNLSEGTKMVVEYEAIAMEGFYPGVCEKIINKRISPNETTSVSLRNKLVMPNYSGPGKCSPDDYEQIKIIQGVLCAYIKVFNPEHKNKS